jgi:spermidine/putrescine transport system substrate-binding protein
MFGRRMSRRRFIGGTGLLAGGVLVGPTLLAACSDDSDSGGGGGSGSADALRISNWPFYIDEETVGQFEEASGLSVTYTEDINDNEEYFAKIQEPLTREQDPGTDLFVVTDHVVARLITLGWLAEIDDANVPNKANIVESLASPEYDPERRYSLPWFSFMTGLAFNRAESPVEVTSVNDLFNPALAGKVSFLSDMRDTVGLLMLADGTSPSEATDESVAAAIERVSGAVDDGQVRRFSGNDYGDDLTAGNTFAGMVYSGDIFQLSQDNPDLEFVFPTEGTLVYTDNMVMPYTISDGAKANAEAWMDFVYDPAQSAQLTAYVAYPPPVEGAVEILAETDPELAADPLVDPSAEDLHEWRPLSEEEEQQYTSDFRDATT